MTTTVRRLRMFAGPNGSGKSSVIRRFSREYAANGLFRLHAYVNADDILANLIAPEGLELSSFPLQADLTSLRNSILATGRVAREQLEQANLQLRGSILHADEPGTDSYLAAAIADWLRETLLANNASFSFETVMSHPNKVQFFQQAQAAGYRTYLYFVATDSPSINSHRIQARVALGGHQVPLKKIEERYYRSLDLLSAALSHATRAYLFDNSGPAPVCVAEQLPDGELVRRVPPDELPEWAKRWVA